MAPAESNQDVARFLRDAGFRDDSIAIDSVPDLQDLGSWIWSTPAVAQALPFVVPSGTEVPLTALYESTKACSEFNRARSATLLLFAGAEAPALCECCKVDWIRVTGVNTATYVGGPQGKSGSEGPADA